LVITAVVTASETDRGERGLARPGVSNLNPSRCAVASDALFAALGSARDFDVYNNAGTVDVVIDLAGLFEAVPDPPVLPAAVTQAAGQRLRITRSWNWDVSFAGTWVSQ
jgi:hypothetical protein